MGRFEKIVWNFVKDLVANEYDFEFKEFDRDSVSIVVKDKLKITVKVTREIVIPEEVERVSANAIAVVEFEKGEVVLTLSKANIEDASEVFELIEELKTWLRGKGGLKRE